MWNYAKAYAIIQIEGLSLERFLSLAVRKGITLRDVKRTGPKLLVLTAAASQLSELVSIADYTRVNLIVLKRGGLEVLWGRLWERKVLLLGTAAGLLALCILSTRLWFIRIEGTNEVSPEAITKLLDENGIRVGGRANDVDLVQLAHRLAAQTPEISWMGLTLEGVTLKVDVNEAKLRPAVEESFEAANVVAAKSGTITKVITLLGHAAVKAGQWVEAGDPLILGHVVHNEVTTDYYVCASGEVYAAVSYTATAEAPETRSVELRTGKTSPYLRVELFSKVLFTRGSRFETYELEREERSGLGLLLPLVFTRGSYFETETAQEALTCDERIYEAELLAKRAALAQVPSDARVIAISCRIVEEDGRIFAVCSVIAEESIGTVQEIYG